VDAPARSALLTLDQRWATPIGRLPIPPRLDF
jgi:hypothetical protein